MSPKPRVTTLLGASAVCGECEWREEVTEERDFMPLLTRANMHAKREGHDVMLTVERLYPGSRRLTTA